MTEVTDNKTKLQLIKRKLLKESAILIGALLLLGGITYYLSSLSDDMTNKNNLLQGEAASAASEMAALQDKYNKVMQNTALYEEAMRKNARDGLSINRQAIHDQFNHFKEQYYLNNLRLSMGAIEDLADPQYKRKTIAMIDSRVTVDFNALSDEHVFNLINVMQGELTGGVKITKLTLGRDNNLTEDVLRIISQTGSYPLVRGQMEFLWLGIKPIEPSDLNADPKLKH